MNFQPTLDFARAQDGADPLALYREQFYIPEINGKPSIYLCGNSLGLQPKSTERYIHQELEDWRRLGVEGHLEARRPWLYYHHFFSEKEARLVGGQKEEVIVMNSLTVNLHLLMISFYRPSRERFKIMVEGQLFPSDHYAITSQLSLHGFHAEDALVELMPREGEHYVRHEDVLEAIECHGDELALILLGGVNYYSGQLFDMESVTRAGQKAGAIVGFDLAHAVGNVPMELHDWNVDFACWCTYKYLNSGPGGPAGAFVHERHGKNNHLPRLAGWWGHREEVRFQMAKGFEPMEGAAGWQLSNAPVMGMAAHLASLDIFDEVGINALRAKSERLTGFLAYLIKEWKGDSLLNVITPDDPAQRGCQLSVLTGPDGEDIFRRIKESGVIADWRNPNVIRVAPVPLYNSFEDVYRFAAILCDKST